MDSDNPATEPGELTVDDAAVAFSQALEPQEVNAQEEGAGATPAEPEVETVEVDIDGTKVNLPKSAAEKLNAERLMQQDYTKKTMALADQRKAAEAEQNKARQERDSYAQKLQEQAMLLNASLQDAVDPALIESNPVEYLKQTALREQRQAALVKANEELSRINQQREAEQKQAFSDYVAQQQEALLAKLPDWKDEKKATEGKKAVRDYLKTLDFKDEEIGRFSDHRAVLLAHKAMLYDNAVAKASAAAKKVATLPTKVERPGVTETPASDQRSAAFRQLSRTGRIEDAARAFASIL